MGDLEARDCDLPVTRSIYVLSAIVGGATVTRLSAELEREDHGEALSLEPGELSMEDDTSGAATDFGLFEALGDAGLLDLSGPPSDLQVHPNGAPFAFAALRDEGSDLSEGVSDSTSRQGLRKLVIVLGEVRVCELWSILAAPWPQEEDRQGDSHYHTADCHRSWGCGFRPLMATFYHW
jgi:hypothetical protein